MGRMRWNLSATSSPSSGELDVKVILYDYHDVKKQLREQEPELAKAMNKEIREYLKPVSVLAKGKVDRVVMSGWRKRQGAHGKEQWSARRGWDQAEVKRGISIRQGGRSKAKAAKGKPIAAWKLTNRSAAGAIYEVAGSRTSGKGVAGQNFVTAIRDHGGRPSRLIWQAWDELGGEKKLTAEVVDIIHKYESKLNRSI